jgi:hypothetical protein
MSEFFVPGKVLYKIPGQLPISRQRGKFAGDGFLCVVERPEQFDPFCGRFALTVTDALVEGSFLSHGPSATDYAWKVVAGALILGFMPTKPIADCRSDEILVKFLV